MTSPAADEQGHNGLWRRIDLRDRWASLDIDSHSLLMMLKGALPPTIVIAISQSDAIADITLTVGYLAALMSVTSQCLMPRAKFVKIMLFSLLATCVAASLCCLVNYCAVKARLHSLPANASESVRTGYNSDACAVAAVWLIVLIWAANAIRAWRPMELQDPMVSFSIFSTVTITRVGTFATVSEGLLFISRLLKTFMIGYAIATAVSLLILPITSRGHVFHDMRDYVAQVQNVLKCQIDFVKEISQTTAPVSHGLLSRTRTALDNDLPKTGCLQEKQNALNASMAKLNALHTKLNSDLFYSKDEIARGKLSAEDLATAAVLFKDVLLPLSGMSMLAEILEMMVQESSSRDDEGDENIESKRAQVVQKIIETLREHLSDTLRFSTAGMQYYLLALQLTTPKQLTKDDKKWDEESTGESLNPLQPNFLSRFERALHGLYNRQRGLPWEQEQDIGNNEKSDENLDVAAFASNSDVQHDFFLLLYMEHMQRILLNATLELIKFADSKVSDGTMKSNRLIFPKQESIKTWFSLQTDDQKNWSHASASDGEDKEEEEQEAENFLPDPEHLPPANAWEKASNILRYISQTIRSELSVFGFRVAAASFCVAILAFLRQTQQFFFHGRCIWAMIVIVIGMTPTSGQTMYGFVARIIATTVSVVLSLIVWYIVDEKTPGIIIFLYLANVFEYYFYVKKPQYFGPIVISIVTLNVIVGYELQARKLGRAVATSNDQPYYPIYIFGPYKLAAVAAGCGISFFWVIFPYPITARSKLRKLLGQALFVLAKFYGAMHNTIEIWMSSGVSDGSRTLSDVRQKLFKEEMMLLTTLRTLSHFTTFEPPIGGRFPKETYDNIISEAQRLLTCMSLMVSTTQNLETLYPSRSSSTAGAAAGQSQNEENWISHLATIAFKSSDFKSHITSSLLCHFSASLTNGQPLPPYLRTPYSFPLARQIQKIDKELLSIRHVHDPAFSAFVSLEVLRSVVTGTLGHLLKDVKTLVGELSVGLHAVQPESLRLMADDSDGDQRD